MATKQAFAIQQSILSHSAKNELTWTNYKQTKSHSCFGEQENHVLMMLFHYTAAFQPQPRVKV